MNPSFAAAKHETSGKRLRDRDSENEGQGNEGQLGSSG